MSKNRPSATLMRVPTVAVRVGWVLLITFTVTTFALFVATKLGVVQQFVVVSGSMEPEISTGSFVLARPLEASAVTVRDVVVVSVPGAMPVIHRVTETSPGPEGKTVLRLKGDANNAVDATPYVVDEVHSPAVVVPYLGRVVSTVQNATSTVTVSPLITGLGVVLLVGAWVMLLPPRPVARHAAAP